MRWLGIGWLTAGVAVLLLVGPSAATASSPVPLRGQVMAGGLVELAGASNMTLQSPGLVASWSEPPADFAVRFSLHDARVRVVNAPYQTTQAHVDGVTGYSGYQPLPPETESDRHVTGELALVDADGNASLWILPLDAADHIPIHLTNATEVRIQPSGHARLPEMPYPVNLLQPQRPLAMRGNFGAVETDGEIHTTPKTSLAILLWGGTFDLDDGAKHMTIQAGEHENERLPPQTPANPARVQHVDRRAILVEGFISVEFTTLSAEPWLTTFDSFSAALTGSLRILEPEGLVRIDDWDFEAKGAYFQADGEFHLDGRAMDDDRTRMRIDGQATRITNHGQTIVSGAPDASSGLAGAGLVLLALFVAVHWFREVLAGIFGSRGDPLAHRLRARAMNLARKRPGFTQKALAEDAGIHPWLARYHLDILTRSGHLAKIKIQGAYSYVPNGKSQSEATTSANGSNNDQALSRNPVHNALLHHPKRRWIFVAATRVAWPDFETMSRWWNKEEVPDAERPSRRDLSYHGPILEEAGLIHRTKQGRNVYWRPVDRAGILDGLVADKEPQGSR